MNGQDGTTMGYYSLVQFCPDRSRLEAANIGVVLLCPEVRFLKARMAEHNHRVRRFFGPLPEMDSAQLTAAKEAVSERLARAVSSVSGLTDLRRIVRTMANQIILTEPRPMRVADPDQDLLRLFEDLVGPERPRASRPSAGRVTRILRRAFRRPEFEGVIKHGIDVETPTHERVLKIPFAFQNGKLNLILPETFSLRDVDSAEKKACRIAVQSEYLRRSCEQGRGPMDLLVVGQFDGNREVRTLVQDIFAVPQPKVDLFDADNLDPLLDYIRHTAVGPEEHDELWRTTLQDLPAGDEQTVTRR